MQPGLAPVGIASGLGLLFFLSMWIGMAIGFILLLVAVWRGMKAHESIADALNAIAANLMTER
jgi:glycerol-3-phosphate acyltransferase PlsY